MSQITSEKLFKLGYEISDILIDNKISQSNQLSLTVDENTFKKIDEDLYYRNANDGEDKFIPSFSEIDIKFPNLTIIIKKELS